MKQAQIFALMITILVAALELAYLYIDASSQLENTRILASNQESQIVNLNSMVNSLREASELINVTRSFGIGFGRAHISLVGTFHSLLSKFMINGTMEREGYVHQSEYAYIYTPRDNVTLRVTASLYDSLRDVPIRVYSGSLDSGTNLTSLLYTFEVKPNAYNEFSVTLPEKGWYSVSSFGTLSFWDPRFDYNINVEMMMLDGVNSIPFVIRSWELG